MGLKVSQLNVLNTVDGAESILVVSNGESRKIPLSLIKTLLDKNDVGLGNVNNTADIDKPISQLVQIALNSKASIVHNHSVSDITGLTGILNSKAPMVHQHQVSDIIGLTTEITNIVANTTSPSDVAVGLLEW